jgi:hypothetical protein
MGLTPDEEADLLREYGKRRDAAIARDRAIEKSKLILPKRLPLCEQKLSVHMRRRSLMEIRQVDQTLTKNA